MQEIEFATLILSFTAYYFIERCFQLVLAAYDPPFHKKLQASQKHLVFFGIWMGLLISAFSTPFCIQGSRNAWTQWQGANGQRDGWSLDPPAKVCVVARGVLWVSELNRLDMYGIYVIHHAGSILSLLSFLYFEWPAVVFLIIFSTLVSEIPGDLVWIVSSYTETIANCPLALLRFKSRLVRFNVVQYILIRGAGLSAVFWMLWTNTLDIHRRHASEQTYAYTLLGLYILFSVSYVLRQYHSIRRHPYPANGSPVEMWSGTAQVPTDAKHEWSRPIHFRIGTNPSIIIVPYGLFMGIGFAALVFISLTIGASSQEGLERLSSALNLTLVSAVAFARLLSIVMENDMAELRTQPLRTILRPGFWLHGGLFGATVGALLAYKLGYVENFPLFAASLAIGLPLYEAFSRIGCHTYGCCYGRVAESSDRIAQPRALWRLLPYPAIRYSHPSHYAATRINPSLLHKPLIPIQLISATLFFLLFIGISLPIARYTTVELAGAATLVCHAATRLITETYRADYRGREGWWLSTTGKLALIQASSGMAWLVSILLAEEGVRVASHLGQFGWLSNQGRVRRSLFAAALGMLVYGIHVGEIGSWVAVKNDRPGSPVGRERLKDQKN